jgi:hypothetical protein
LKERRLKREDGKDNKVVEETRRKLIFNLERSIK